MSPAKRCRLAFRVGLVVALAWCAGVTIADATGGAERAALVPTGRPDEPAAPTVTSSVPSTVPEVPSTTMPPAPVTAAPSAPMAPVTAEPEAPTDPVTVTGPVPDTATPEPAPPAPTAAPAPVAATAAPPCPIGGGDLLGATNRDRIGNSVPALCADPFLTGLAQAWANSMARTAQFTHQDLQPVINGSAYAKMAENILAGPGVLSVAQIEGAFMASPEHRANILDPAYTRVGIGIAFGADGRVRVVVDFGG